MDELSPRKIHEYKKIKRERERERERERGRERERERERPVTPSGSADEPGSV